MGSMVVPIRADQLLPQFMLEPFDSLPPQYRHTGHVHEEILFRKKNTDTLDMCMKKYYFGKNNFNKFAAL